MAKCKGKRKDGKPCQATAQTDNGYCIHHDPDLAEQRQQWKRDGGKAGTLATLRTPKPWRRLDGEGDVTISRTTGPSELIDLLADTIDEVKMGEIDPKIANSVGYLAGVMMKVIQHQAFEERLAAIEEALGVNR